MKPFTILTLLLLSTAFRASGWGQTGHRIVGRIAENHLSAKVSQKVKALLGAETLAQVSTWPDEIRSDPAWAQAAPWHFISIDDGETYETTKKDPKGDVVHEMGRFEGMLRNADATAQDKVIALKFLVHLVGDVHQPLHVGRRADQGGNKIEVTWTGKPAKLHTVWDSEIIDSQQLSFSEFAQFIDHPTPRQVTAWQRTSYIDWVQESFDLRAKVYAIGNGKLGYEYGYANLPIIKERLVQAGVRLAGLLNSILQ